MKTPYLPKDLHCIIWTTQAKGKIKIDKNSFDIGPATTIKIT